MAAGVAARAARRSDAAARASVRQRARRQRLWIVVAEDSSFLLCCSVRRIALEHVTACGGFRVLARCMEMKNVGEGVVLRVNWCCGNRAMVLRCRWIQQSGRHDQAGRIRRNLQRCQTFDLAILARRLGAGEEGGPVLLFDRPLLSPAAARHLPVKVVRHPVLATACAALRFGGWGVRVRGMSDQGLPFRTLYPLEKGPSQPTGHFLTFSDLSFFPASLFVPGKAVALRTSLEYSNPGLSEATAALLLHAPMPIPALPHLF